MESDQSDLFGFIEMLMGGGNFELYSIQINLGLIILSFSMQKISKETIELHFLL